MFLTSIFFIFISADGKRPPNQKNRRGVVGGGGAIEKEKKGEGLEKTLSYLARPTATP